MAKAVALENLPEVQLLENITRETATRVIEQLSAYKGRKVALSIFSDGGDVHAAKAIGSYISNEANSLTVEARVYGNAFSGALIICAHCQTAYISSGSFALGHKAFAVGADGKRIPDTELSDELKTTLDAMNADQVDLFARRTKKRKDTIDKWLSEDRSMTDEEALEFGLFDGIIPLAAKLAAHKQIPAMAEEKKTRKVVVGHKALVAAVLTADGHVELPEEQFTVSDAAKVAELETQKAAIEAQLSELKAKAEQVPTLEAQVASLTTERDQFKAESEKTAAQLEGLKKNPLVASVIEGGKTVVVPGAEATAKKAVPMSERESHFARTQNYLAEYDKRKAAAN